MVNTRFVPHALVGLCSLVAGCGLFSPEEAPPEEEVPITVLPPTSAENVLNNLVFAYENRDHDVYIATLDSAFFFVASSSDTIDDFDRDADIAATERLFDNVDNIDLRLTHGGSVPSNSSEFPPPRHRMIQVSQVNMRVDTRDFSQGDRLVLVVGGDPALFIFKVDSTMTPPVYRIIRQFDES